MKKDKNTLRTTILQQRKNKTDTEIIAKSKQIEKHLLHLDVFKQSTQVLFYVSYDGEVYTHQLIQKSISLNKSVSVPISNKQTHTLQISRLHAFTDLTLGTYGILEPTKEKQDLIDIDILDIIIVPGVGFDTQGNRIGQGGGYYDWLLNKSDATSIALAFEFQLLDRVPTEPHDQKVDMIITEKRVIN